MSNSNNRLPDHFKDFIVALNQNSVEYMIIGGYAMGSYGHVRATEDLDIFIHASEKNAQMMIKACIEYGIPTGSIKKEMFLAKKAVGIGEPPVRIELLKSVGVVDFKYAYQRVKKKRVDGIEVNVIDIDDLILLKEAASEEREKTRDREDLIFLKKLKQNRNS